MGRTMRLSRLLERAGIRPQAPVGPDPEITGVGLDSRSLLDGEMFFALRGARADGESFVPQAVARGARAVLAASSRSSGAPDAVAWVQVGDARRAAGRLAREWYERPDEKCSGEIPAAASDSHRQTPCGGAWVVERRPGEY